MDWAAPNLPNVKPNDSTSFGPTTPSSYDFKLQSELSRLDSAVPFRPKTKYLHHTWAQTFFSQPEFFFQPSSIPELQKIVTLARRCRKRLCVTGYGHSPSDLTCTSSWLINLDKLDKVIEYDVDSTPGLTRFQAGISLHNLNQALATRDYTLPNLGSIDVQSLAGSISTGTHGSSLKHGLLSSSVTSLTILLSNSQLVTCSASKNPELFRASLLSLGSLGIIVEMTFQAVPDFNISWTQSLHPLASILSTWDSSLWTSYEYTRVWWLPYLQRAVIWRANRTSSGPHPPKKTFYGGKLGYYLYHNLLALSNYIPRILPWVEWFIFGMQYGFRPGSFEMSAVEPARNGLLMNCLYSQFVNEWALPLSKGPEAIRRLSNWINHNPDPSSHNIPVSNKGIWVHCPIEVRVSNTMLPDVDILATPESPSTNRSGVRPYLDPTPEDGPTLYLNATLYRPYGRDPPCHERYYQAFEYLMRELGGKPHWAKNFAYTTREYLGEAYGEEMQQFLQVREEVDPDGMFLGEWHRRVLPLDTKVNAQSMSETETQRVRIKEVVKGVSGDGWLWEGKRIMEGVQEYVEEEDDLRKLARLEIGGKPVQIDERGEEKEDGQGTPSPPVTSTSDESFDYMAKGEASVYAD